MTTEHPAPEGPLSSAVLISMLQRLTRERLAKCVAENNCPECAIALAELVRGQG